jgi:peptide/nickel transport system permease protein
MAPILCVARRVNGGNFRSGGSVVSLIRVAFARLLAAIPMMILVSLIIFSIPYFIPGDPAFTIAGPNATIDDIARIRSDLGLDRPIPGQYIVWLGNAVTFDLGDSYLVGRDVRTMIGERMEVMLSLALLSTLFAGLVGIPLGIIAASRIGGVRDRLAVGSASMGVAVPNYWLAAILVTYLAVEWGWFPAAGYVRIGDDPGQWLWHLILPTIALGAISAAEITRQTRGMMAQTMNLDYIRTARMKGLPPRTVIGKHALKNASIPVITALGLQLTVVLGGSVIVEQIFGMPGLGELAITAVLGRDIPVIQGIVLLTTVVAVSTNLLVDIATSHLDPRVVIT